MKRECAGVVIAGGFSRRFGEPKAFAVKNEKYFFQYSLEALQTTCDQLMIVTNKTLENFFKQKTRTTVITDIERFAGKGPLAGVYTAMTEMEADWYAVAPVDTPFIEAETYLQLRNRITKENQAVIAVANERLQPLIGLYHKSLKSVIKELLEKDQLAMQALLDRANTAYVSFTTPDVFININKQADYYRYIKGGEKK